MTTDKLDLARKVKELIRDLVTELIMHPGQLEVTAVPVGSSIVVGIQVANSDMKRVAGKGGIHLKSLKLLALWIGKANEVEVKIQPVAAVGKDEKDMFPPFEPSPGWPREKVLELIRRMVELTSVFGQCVCTVTPVSGEESAINVELDGDESPTLVQVLDAVLGTLFKAIGSHNQQYLTVGVMLGTAGEKQPQSAGGRYSGEVRK